MDLVQLPQKIKIIDGDLVQLEDQDQDRFSNKIRLFLLYNNTSTPIFGILYMFMTIIP